jgi:hypothetical protein
MELYQRSPVVDGRLCQLVLLTYIEKCNSAHAYNIRDLSDQREERCRYYSVITAIRQELGVFEESFTILLP